MRKSKKKIVIVFFIFVSLILLSFSIILAKNNFENINNIAIDKEKIYYEIKYLDIEIINMINLLNNIQNQANFYINWGELKNRTYILYNYWNSIILDLNYTDVKNEDLTDFGKQIDKLFVSINNKNKDSALINLIELYNKLVRYTENIDINEYNNLIKIKYNLFCAYSAAESENWTLAYEYISKATNYMLNIVNSLNVDSSMQYNANQIFIGLKELENIIYIKDFNILNFKYRTLIEKMNNLTF